MEIDKVMLEKVTERFIVDSQRCDSVLLIKTYCYNM